MPLKAILNGEVFWSRDLVEEDRGEEFQCPICIEKMLVVLPRHDIIKHFRHKSGHAHGEPETPEHLQMKSLIVYLLEKDGWTIDVEVKIGSDDYYTIADVTGEKNGIKYAIECQCSSISVDECDRRNHIYDNEGYIPVWILGERWLERIWSMKKGTWFVGLSTSIERYLMDLTPDDYCFRIVRGRIYRETTSYELHGGLYYCSSEGEFWIAQFSMFYNRKRKGRYYIIPREIYNILTDARKRMVYQHNRARLIEELRKIPEDTIENLPLELWYEVAPISDIWYSVDPWPKGDEV